MSAIAVAAWAAVFFASPASAAVEEGAAVASQWCSGCHATGTGTLTADVAPPFNRIAATRSADYVRGFLANPHTRGQMPAFSLSTQQIEDIIAYLQTMAPEGEISIGNAPREGNR